MNTADCEDIRAAVDEAVSALCAHLEPGSLIVLGCSTSEIAGGRIGKASVPELGPVVAGAMIDACRAREMEPAFQCCEHLNRAIVMEKRVLREHGLQLFLRTDPREQSLCLYPYGLPACS